MSVCLPIFLSLCPSVYLISLSLFALPGAAITASAEYISSVEEGGTLELELRDVEPSALRRARERILAREVNAAIGASPPTSVNVCASVTWLYLLPLILSLCHAP